jgi:hypothetical protein
VRIAPHDPNRIYLSGNTLVGGPGSTPQPLLFRSDDGGAHWTNLAFTFPESADIRLLGVGTGAAASEEDLLFVRVDGSPNDTVLRSHDAGVSFTTVTTFPDNVLAFTGRPDGHTYIAGTQSGSVQISSDGGLTWGAPTYSPRMTSVGDRSDDVLFSTGANWDPDHFALGRSADGETWTKVFQYAEIAGPLDCPAGTKQHDICVGFWPSFCAQLGLPGCPIDAGPHKPDAAPAIDAPPRADAATETGKEKHPCGCGVSVALIFVVLPRRRRPAQGPATIGPL